MYNPYNWDIKPNIGEEIAKLDNYIVSLHIEKEASYKEIKRLNEKINQEFKRIDEIKSKIENDKKDKEELWEKYKSSFCFGIGLDDFTMNK